jgi:tRNA A37 threonylcarbamoyladenosine synthetase subunit TsaC/SUA5/YrdC
MTGSNPLEHPVLSGQIDAAVTVLRGGGIVALPTDTV